PRQLPQRKHRQLPRLPQLPLPHQSSYPCRLTPSTPQFPSPRLSLSRWSLRTWIRALITWASRATSLSTHPSSASQIRRCRVLASRLRIGTLLATFSEQARLRLCAYLLSRMTSRRSPDLEPCSN